MGLHFQSPRTLFTTDKQASHWLSPCDGEQTSHIHSPFLWVRPYCGEKDGKEGGCEPFPAPSAQSEVKDSLFLQLASSHCSCLQGMLFGGAWKLPSLGRKPDLLQPPLLTHRKTSGGSWCCGGSPAPHPHTKAGSPRRTLLGQRSRV